MDANHTSRRGVTIDDRFLDAWVELGMAELRAYLAKHARFAAWCERRDRRVRVSDRRRAG